MRFDSVVVVKMGFALMVLACVGAVSLPGAAMAQSSSDPGASGASAGGFGGHRGRRRQTDGSQPAKPVLEKLTPKPEPRQRLDAGALLCPTEADLEQHQAAVTARLDGRDAADPVACHQVGAMTAVAVVDRHGPARTEVRMPGQPEQLGWTDAVVHDP